MSRLVLIQGEAGQPSARVSDRLGHTLLVGIDKGSDNNDGTIAKEGELWLNSCDTP